jgi:hypothetical protein
MAMVIIEKETGLTSGTQTHVQDKETRQHFLVTSIVNPVINKTFIVKCNPNNAVSDWNEVYCCIPANHYFVVDALTTGVLTTKNFNFCE